MTTTMTTASSIWSASSGQGQDHWPPRGTVINICSAHALQSKPGLLPYAVSKAALAGLTRLLALDLAPRGIRVNEIRPGATARSMLLAGFERYPQALARVADAAFVVDGGIGVRVHDPL